jgi:hypothetical protein
VDKKKNSKIIINNMEKIELNRNEYFTYPIEIIEKNKEEKLLFLNSLGWQSIADDSTKIKLPTRKQASEFEDHLYIKHYSNGQLELYNLIPDNVIVKNILFNGKSFHNDEFIVPSYLFNNSPIVIDTQIIGIQDNKFTVVSEYQGFNRKNDNKITLISEDIINPLLLENFKDIDIINKIDNENYEFKKGNWILREPLVINGNLFIPSGVNLKFSKNAYLIVKGAITAIGKINNPIKLEPLTDTWKGIFVLNATKESNLKNVVIQNITALEDSLLRLTGGITFYKSDVNFDQVTIKDVKAEDAINIVESNFNMHLVYINNTTSDGLDSDFSEGSILNSNFSNINGDALDFSGSNVEIDKVIITNVRDKGISGGEKSIINIKNSTFNTIGVGIASKDGSDLFITNSNISNYKLHAAMSYIKKNYYPVPSIKIIDCNVDNDNPYIRQKGTKMLVDNIEIAESEVDVDKLYQNEVMKN